MTEAYPSPWHVSAMSRDGRGLAFVVSADNEIITCVDDLAAAHLIAAAPDMDRILNAVLLLHSGAPWDAEQAQRWEVLMGPREATTRMLCDAVHAVRAKAGGGKAR